MENKKLLKYLLNDLSELDEMFAEQGKNRFDDLEIEFIQNRISGAIRLVKLFLEKENKLPENVKTENSLQQKADFQTAGTIGEKPATNEIKEIQDFNAAVKTPGVWIEEKKSVTPESLKEIEIEEKTVEKIREEKVVVIENNIAAPELVQENRIEILEQVVIETPKQGEKSKQDFTQNELQLEDEVELDIHNKRLGDSFLKEKSVNDIRSDDLSKLEHKLSNRPVTSIQSAIGINDRFQYIRELFEGSADNFVKTVADLDSMNNIKEAVDYLQTNFKWKKNEASLKFVNIIKRRFPNE